MKKSIFLILIGLFLLGFKLERCSTKSENKIVAKLELSNKSANGEIVWHWESNFTAVEKNEITKWLEKVTKAKDSVIGIYPFEMHFYLKKREKSREPVPWAHTQRGQQQSIYFYIDPRFSLEEFLHDWTAPHEISHLSIPFVGGDDAWFAEGYASFMQYQIMKKMGIYSSSEITTMYRDKIIKVTPKYKNKKLNLIKQAQQLRKTYHFSEMYWGSSAFFILIDGKLKEQSSISLTQLITHYQSCCRKNDFKLQMILDSWNKISGKNLIKMEYRRLEKFPASEILAESITYLKK